MIYLLHGDDNEKSRNEYYALRQKYKDKEIRVLEGAKITPNLLTQALQAPSLFGKDMLVCIENLLTKQAKKRTLIKELITLLEREKDSVDVIIWESKTLTKSQVSRFKDITVKLYKLPASIFKFLDAFRPNNTKEALDLYEQTITHTAAQIIFSMLVKRIRYLIMVKDHVTPKGLASWQINQLVRQARAFTKEQLVTIQLSLIELDKSVKTGTTAFNTEKSLRQIIAGM